MGKGTLVDKNGVNIAFTAGTGCLVFLDMVAFLIKLNLGIAYNPKDFGPDFKFVFYTSFRHKGDSIALDLCEGLQRVCKEKGLDNFVFFCRLSD